MNDLSFWFDESFSFGEGGLLRHLDDAEDEDFAVVFAGE